LNPRAETPTLVHDGQVIRESSLICDYIEDIYPQPKLRPEAPLDKVRMREWIKLSDDKLYEVVASLSFVSVFRKVMNGKSEEEKEQHFRNQTDLGRVMRQRSCVEKGFDSDYVIRGVYNFINLAEAINSNLSDGREWMLGDFYSLAEINYIPFIARLDALCLLTPFLDNNSYFEDWWHRCKQRESVVTAEVGPAQGDEAQFYEKSGEEVVEQLVKLIGKIRSTSIYDLSM
jgi:glutathione S-transferase